MFKFKPKSDEEIAMEGMIPAGTYDFSVVEAEEQVSKSGNPMVKLKLQVFTDNGNRFAFDYLIEAMAKKFKHFFRTAGLEKAYDAGEVTIDQIRAASGKVVIAIEPEKTVIVDGESKTFPPRTIVEDYGTPEDKPAKPVEKKFEPPAPDDNLPY